ncbi:MAG: alpha-glucan family phosphorylase [Candidatus Melainabacteria bacterium]|nr:alpha-glucan family phosphorylase [Candidatus Melainabacteria bacterium]
MSLPHVAYFSMEMAIDQSLHTYSGGLGFLAGSHMLSAGALKLPLIGVTILWTQGYGDQVINEQNQVDIVYRARNYPFLKETGITVDVSVFGEVVKVKALKLEPETFNTVPVYFLTTDIAENKPEHRYLTQKLYDGDQKVRISQEIILGIGGLRAIQAAQEPVDVVHLNEGHALPAAFELLSQLNGNIDEVRRRMVFTTHTPVAAGNETHPVQLLAESGFFANTSVEEAIRLGGHEFSLTVAALRMSRMANGVSQLHGQVANNMWSWVEGRCPIVAITNSTNLHYWQDARIKQVHTNEELLAVKREMKREMFESIERETGKTFDDQVLTVVWARRFTEYKRADLIFSDMERIKRLLDGKKLQLVFAGKFHPLDTWGRNTWNRVLELSQQLNNVVILPGYELSMSGLLKRGADLWLNTPLRPLEASGTSGMSANMNGAIHMSTFDGWAVEGTYHGLNGFTINERVTLEHLPIEERHRRDYESMMDLLENTVVPMYYQNPTQWANLMRHAIQIAESYFHSDRMVIEYYNRLYKPISL